MNTPQEAPRQRRRPPLSCIPCRKRKIKCDRNDPCNHCISAATQCIYRSDPRILSRRRQQPQGDQPRAVSSVTPTSQSNASPHNDQDVDRADVVVCDAQQANVEPACPQLHLPGTGTVAGGVLSTPAATPKDVDPSAKHSTKSSSILLQDLQTAFNKSRMTDPDKSDLYQLHNTMAFFREVVGDRNTPWSEELVTRDVVDDCRQLLRSCKAIARAAKTQQRPTRHFAHPGLILSPPPRDLSDQMAQLYFQYFESTHRILHAPTFWTEYEAYWVDPTGSPLSARFKILLTVAIGSSLHDQGRSTDFCRSVWQWIYACQTWLSGPLEKDRVNVEAMAVHCLLILTRQILGLGVDLIWASTGSLIHRAFQIGLHRDPKHLPKTSILQAEIRRRLWATILEIVVQSSLDSEMHPRISTAEYDTEPPSNINDIDVSEATTVLVPRPGAELTSTSIQLILMKAVPIRLQILTTLYGLASEVSYDTILDLNARMVAVFSDYESISNITQSSLTFQRNMLDFMMRRFLLHLHSPFAFRAEADSAFHFSRKAAFDAAIAIISPEPDERFSVLMKSGAGVFKAGNRLASVIISAEVLAHTRTQRNDLSLRRTSEHREVLKRTIRSFMSLAEDRLRCREFKPKDHMFLATVIAEVEAIELGASPNLTMAQAAKTSLQSCYEILQNQHGAVAYSNIPNTDVNLDLGWEDFDFDIWSFLQYTELQ